MAPEYHDTDLPARRRTSSSGSSRRRTPISRTSSNASSSDDQQLREGFAAETAPNDSNRRYLMLWLLPADMWSEVPSTLTRSIVEYQHLGAKVMGHKERLHHLWQDAEKRGWRVKANQEESDKVFDEISWHYYLGECKNHLQAARMDAIALVHAVQRAVKEAQELCRIPRVRDACGVRDLNGAECIALKSLVEWLKDVVRPLAEQIRSKIDDLECPTRSEIEDKREGRGPPVYYWCTYDKGWAY